MELTDFPDMPARGSNKTLATIGNVAHLLSHAGIQARYNVINKRVEIEIPGHRGTSDNFDNVTMTEIVSLTAKHGMPTALVPEYVNAIADRCAYNPVADWIRGREWDGEDRLESFFATVVEQSDYPRRLKETLMRKWLRSAAAAALVPGYKGRGVLTLQGPQGVGKTSWVRSLVNDPKLCEAVVKLDHHLDPTNKDSTLGAVCNWLVEIGELESSFRRDVHRLKGFLTSDYDRVRRPYDRKESEYPRRTVFLATVNDDCFLVDPTGNTRWWTIAVEKLDYRHDIDMQQVFAQVASEVDKGGEWWLNQHEEAALEDWNGRHRTVSVIAEKLLDHLDLDAKGQSGLPALTATEALEVLGYERPTNPQAKECASALREILGEPKRIGGRYKWRVPLKEPTADDLKPHKLPKPEDIF